MKTDQQAEGSGCGSMRATFFSRLLDVAVVLATLASQSGIATAAATERDIRALANSTYAPPGDQDRAYQVNREGELQFE